ncbi:hypothetical protein [Flavobacterium sp.]|uniref:hypothetical protein n=1 Tax=Flavobacterium sp. TaxID=239 RepID=UPI0025C0F18D|nr:hypothetical protein [Flavobacterium sp.]
MNRLSKRQGRGKCLLMLSLLFVSQLTFAQFDTPEEAPMDEDQLNAALNPPDASIDQWVWPALLMGMASGWYLIRKRKAYQTA